nr:glycosyltransferase [Pseudozobellia sp. WGM2]
MREGCIFIIGFTWPEPTSTAAGNRMLQLLSFFLNQNYRIVFGSTAKESERSLELKNMGVDTENILLNNSSFDEFLTQLRPDIVIFDRFLTEEQFGWRVAEFVPKALRVLDTEDLHSLRYIREKNLKSSQSFSIENWLREDVAKREIASIYRCDLSLIISSYEMKLLQEINIDKSLLHHLPFFVNPIKESDLANWTPYYKRHNFISIGNGKHKPNLDALRWLKNEIWPKIRTVLPKAQLSVYGAYLPQQIEQMHNSNEGFLVKGWVADAESEMALARVNLAPLRFGAGIKGKLLLGMQTGTPSVTTPIGAEGMHSNLPWGGLICESAENIANAAFKLYTDKQEWLKAQSNGISIINEVFDNQYHKSLLMLKIHELQADLEQHRSRNLTGVLLQHHSSLATKYMAKWIEEKNRKSDNHN